MTVTSLTNLLMKTPKGPRIEFGVLSGDSLLLIADHSSKTWAVDSFQGMPEPGPDDIRPDGVSEYPKGKLSRPLSIAQGKLARYGDRVKFVKGWVPDILSEMPEHKWAFAHIDLDHYAPTWDCINWLLPRMLKDGIICCDDYIPGRMFLAGKAIDEFNVILPMTGHFGRKAYWQF